MNPAPLRVPSQSAKPGISSRSSWDINNNFQFAFPKFGFGVGAEANESPELRSNSNPTINRNNSLSSQSPGGNTTVPSPGNLSAGNMSDLSNLFSPSILASVSSNSETDYMNFPTQNRSGQSPAANSLVSKKSTERAGSEANSNSPASSTQNGFTSSCVTTPEYYAESPEQRKAGDAAFGTIGGQGEDRRQSKSQEAFCKEFSGACGTKKNPVPAMLADSDQAPASSTASTALQPATPSLDSQSFDFFANQNGGILDPQLFGDYRDPQENIMNGDFGFFNDAFPLSTDFGLDQRVDPLVDTVLPKKRDLMREIEENMAGKEPEVVPGENTKQFLTCNMLWYEPPSSSCVRGNADDFGRDRVQRSSKVQSGEADMDDLCSQLKAKAKCSGQGAVIEQRDVDAILGPSPVDPKELFKMFK